MLAATVKLEAAQGRKSHLKVSFQHGRALSERSARTDERFYAPQRLTDPGDRHDPLPQTAKPKPQGCKQKQNPLTSIDRPASISVILQYTFSAHFNIKDNS
jgi:hypothetical protein